MKDLCEWCGHEHPLDALCSRRPKWGRRGFLCMLGAGLAGIAAGQLPLPAPAAFEWHVSEVGGWGEASQLFLATLDVSFGRLAKELGQRLELPAGLAVRFDRRA